METKLIIVGGTKGGPGKSTVAQQVAAGLQLKRGKKVHITDIDIQQTTTSWCEERRNNKNLDLIAFSYIENDIVKHLQSLNGRYEYIVVDAGGFDSEIQREAMLIADIVLLPLRPKRRDLKSLRDLDTVLESVKSSNPEVQIRAVLNQCPSLPSQVSRILSSKDIIESFGIKCVPTNIYTRNVYDDAEEAGRSIFEMKGKDRDKGGVGD
ncbi:AAA family ATPase (plasmid) [Klebsiella pneumoniae]|uniref:AAA family ATPase n=1 Tax=Klebsiella pneumoniae TaxID=573 RepID=UPI0020237A24|nr:AAA family ATPase [Klebsiella pneumoniae]URI72871.1 AAA family ATPase [Klebsiella pneumoniae]